MFLRQPRQSGFSLVELMVAMVVGLFVAAIVATMYVSIIRANSTTVQLARLNQDLQASLDVMARDIQRAGYVSGAEAALSRDTSGEPVNSTMFNMVNSATFSAFTVASGALTNTQKDLVTSVNGDCILIRYDANGNGVIAGDDPPEILGYKYNSTNKRIDSGTWASTANQSCTATTGWQVLAGGDGHIDITGLKFTVLPVSGASPSFRQRSIVVTVSGASSRDANLDISLERTVRLRNDQFIEE